MMRLFTGLVSLGLLTACQSGVERESSSLEDSPLSFGRAQSRIETQELESGQIVLLNKDFQSLRRATNRVADRSSMFQADSATVEALAQKHIADLYPDLEFRTLSLNQGKHSSVASFQQVYKGRDVVGARASLRLLPSGDWRSVQSYVVSAEILESLPEDPDHSEIASSRYFAEPHVVLEENRVIYPRVSDQGTEVFWAREFKTLSLTQQLEFMFWIDESHLRAVGGFQPSGHLLQRQVQGHVVPNSPVDLAEVMAFPAVAFVQGDQTHFSQSDGMLPSLTGKATLKLSNPVVSVVHNERSNQSFEIDFDDLDSTVDLNQFLSIEEQNIFYWVMRAKAFMRDNFGFDKQRTQLTAIARFGNQMDNAFFMPTLYQLAFGVGKAYLKNTALSRDIVIHEYGHSVIFEKYGIVGGYEFSAMNEAMSDYLAATITNDPAIAEDALQPALQRRYLRSVGTEMRYPEQFSGKGFHVDGQIFSGALWKLRSDLGAETADALIHQAQLAQSRTIFEFYLELQAIAEDQDDGNPFTASPYESAIREAFRSHGIGSRDVSFNTAPPDNLTEPWKIGCWSYL
jgi:hypothetical protein